MIKATEKETGQLYKIIEKRAEWLKEKGIKQWNPPYPRELFFKDVSNGSVFYFTDNNQVIGTATLHEHKPAYYPKDLWNDSVRCWYLCRFAVALDLKNKNVGKKIIEEIFQEAKKSNIERIRIDIVKANPFLEEYYSRHGFSRVREDIVHETPEIFMEKTF